MKVYRDLYIRGDSGQVEAAAQDILQSLAEGWSRDSDAEAHMRSTTAGGRKVYCIACPKRLRRPAATLFLLEKEREPGAFFLANIVPSEKGRLSHEEYNAIVEDFYKRYAAPAADRHGARAEMTEANADLEDWLPQDASEKLRKFSRSANKSTGSSHPMDRDRWYDFLVAAHEADADFTASTLARWLVESGGWDDELANRLATEYEFGRGLLTFTNGATVKG